MFHTYKTLEVSTVAMVSLSLVDQDRSLIPLVCPACMNNISGGPSFSSSSLRVSLILDRSHTKALLSVLADAMSD